MKKYKVEQIAAGLELGEGCIWDKSRNAIHYVDISKFFIYTYYTESQEIKDIYVGDYVGCVFLDSNYNLVAAIKNKLVRINPETDTREVICELNLPTGMRFNDGKCDQYGNIWVGTIAIEYGTPETKGAGSLFCIRNNQIISEYVGYSIPNGLDWSNDGENFFHIDTEKGTIDKYQIVEKEKIINRNVVVRIPTDIEGAPDGMCMDRTGNFWAAMWGGASVNCYSAKDGNLLQKIELPHGDVTCCTFGGGNLNDLYITTAASQECSGGLFVVKDMDVTGKEPQKYGY